MNLVEWPLASIMIVSVIIIIINSMTSPPIQSNNHLLPVRHNLV